MRPGDTLEATRMRVYGKPAAPFLSGILARLSFFRGHCLAFMPRSTWKSQNDPGILVNIPDQPTALSPPEEFTMSTIIRIGACAIGIASLIATSGPALAMTTTACKNPVEVGGGILPGEPQAKSYAKSKWVQATKIKYGAFWANYSMAKSKHYTCKKVKGGTTCKLSAQPCGQATRRSTSDY